MSRVTDALLGNQAFGVNANQPLLDLTYGGQGGYAPNLTEWISNQAYVRRNLIPVVLEYPRFFDLMPNPDVWVRTLKSLIETHVRTIEGFNAALTAEFDEHPVGGGGEMQQEVTDMKRARTEPVLGFVEKAGNPIQIFLQYWMQYGMMDPDTKYALAGTLGSSAPSDLLADWSSMTCLFFEPDPTHRKVVKSWITANMMPKETGDIIGKRDLTSASEVLNLSIPFTGISQFGFGTNAFAQTILDAINIEKANPFTRKSFISEISQASLKEDAVKNSYAKSVAAVSGNQIG